MTSTCLALACVALLWGGLPAWAGEARVTQAKGSRLTVEAGAGAGLAVGMEVTVIRPPGEPIVHPITGENLGAPEVDLGVGRVTKVSQHAAVVEVGPQLLMVPRAGDVVRFASAEDQMVVAQERVAVAEVAHRAEHKAVGEDIARLAQGIKDVQGRIGSLEKIMQRIERVEEGFRAQLRGLTQDMSIMKEDIRGLKQQVSLYGAPPVRGIEEQQKVNEPVLTQEQVDRMVQDALTKLQPVMQPAPSAPAAAPATQTVSGPAYPEPAPATQPEPQAGAPEPQVAPEAAPAVPEPGPAAAPPDEMTTQVEAPPAEVPFWQKTWFFGVIGAVGIIGVAGYLYTRMSAASQEDEEEEEDEELEEDEEEEEAGAADAVEVEGEEEDDIVVEETSR